MTFSGSPNDILKKIIRYEIPLIAPMAGVTHRAYRYLMRSYGLEYCFAEMVKCRLLAKENERTIKKLERYEGEHSLLVQLFGGTPDEFEGAAKTISRLQLNPDWIDINMGCPVKKIVRERGGAALLEFPETFRPIIEAIRSYLNVPISAKIRLGLHQDCLTRTVEHLLEAGIKIITVHPRLSTSRYDNPLRWDRVAEIKRLFGDQMTLLVSGNMFRVEDYISVRKLTGCDGWMVARGILRNPQLLSGDTNEPDIKIVRNYVHKILQIYPSFFPPHTLLNEIKRAALRAIKSLNDPLLYHRLAQTEDIEVWRTFSEDHFTRAGE